MDDRRTFTRLFPVIVAAAIVVADRWTKIAIQRSMTLFDSVSIVPGWLRIVRTENPGAAFGVLAEGDPYLRRAVLIGVSAVVLGWVAVTLWKRRHAARAGLTRLALALVLGGAAGNLYDRVVHGAVTDFIEVYRGAWAFPAFNVADSAITVGAALLILDMLRSDRRVQTGAQLAKSK